MLKLERRRFRLTRRPRTINLPSRSGEERHTVFHVLLCVTGIQEWSGLSMPSTSNESTSRSAHLSEPPRWEPGRAFRILIGLTSLIGLGTCALGVLCEFAMPSSPQISQGVLDTAGLVAFGAIYFLGSIIIVSALRSLRPAIVFAIAVLTVIFLLQILHDKSPHGIDWPLFFIWYSTAIVWTCGLLHHFVLGCRKS